MRTVHFLPEPVIIKNRCIASPCRENNCQELKKETEDKIQTLVSDHKAKVMQIL